VLVVVLAACSSSSAASPRLVAQTSSPAARPTSVAHSPHVRAVEPTATKVPAPKTSRRRTYPNIPAADLPRHPLTPGIALAVSLARVCTSGYASGARDVSDAEKADVYARYGVAWVPYAHEVDHLISLELGGSNVIRNLWPEPYAGRWGARTKDVLENRLHDLVCEGRLSLASAQRQESRDWVAAYRKYVRTSPAGGNTSGGTSPGGYFASSYPTASTIYCEDDSAGLPRALRDAHPGEGALPELPPAPALLSLDVTAITETGGAWEDDPTAEITGTVDTKTVLHEGRGS
jgi:hypothetical protein